MVPTLAGGNVGIQVEPACPAYLCRSAGQFWMRTSSSALKILPLTIEIARETPPLASVLRDPADCLIVATARVHGLRLLTSDERIVASKLAQIVD